MIRIPHCNTSRSRANRDWSRERSNPFTRTIHFNCSPRFGTHSKKGCAFLHGYHERIRSSFDNLDKSLEKITDLVAATTKSAKSIYLYTQKQSQKTEEVLKAIQNISRRANEALGGAEKTASAIQDLDELTVRLNALAVK